MQQNHNYEKPSRSFCFACRFYFHFLLCKGQFKVKNQFASGTSKKSGRNTIRKTVCSGPAEALREPGFVSWGGCWIFMKPALVTIMCPGCVTPLYVLFSAQQLFHSGQDAKIRQHAMFPWQLMYCSLRLCVKHLFLLACKEIILSYLKSGKSWFYVQLSAL